MKRKHKVYLYTYFGPCMLMVITSWISFTVDSAAVPGRLGLLLTLLLMMINLNNSVSSTIPKSTKVTPLTVWIMVSIGFVSFALLEYAVILYSEKFVSKKQRKETKKEPEKNMTRLNIIMDRLALGIFPVCYALFVIIFNIMF